MANTGYVRETTNAAARVIKELADYLTCPICYQLYRNPKYLICHHSCCEACLVKLQKEGIIVCPECRKVTPVCAGGIRELPNNFFITRLVDELTVKRMANSEEAIQCDQCVRGAPVEVFCVDCTLFMCGHCREHHRYDKQYHNHHTIPLSDVSSDIILQPKGVTTLCPEHDNELKYYCDTCKELVCLYCTTKKHNTHEHETVKNVIGKHRKNLDDVIAPIIKIIDGLSQAHQQVDTMIQNIDMQYEKASKEIEQCYEKLYKKLQQQRDMLMKELDETLAQSKEIIQARAEKLECLQGQFESIRELHKTLATASDQEMLLVEQEVIARVEALTIQYIEFNSKPPTPVIINFNPTEVASLPQFGKLFSSLQCSPCNSEITFISKYTLVYKPVNLTVTTRDHCNQLRSIGTGDIVVQVETGVEGDSVMELKMMEDDYGTYTGSFTPQHIGQCNVSVILEGQHIRGSPHVIMVGRNYLAIDKPSKVINNKAKMGHPWGIAFSKHGRWAVTDCTNSCVYTYNVNDELVTKFCGNDDTRLYNPCGIAFDDSENLYVVDCTSYGVKKFDISGNFLLHFSSETEQFENPLGIAVHNDRVYVASSGCVLVFDVDGQYCCKIGSGVLSTTPYDVTVDHNNQLLVADSGFNCIFTFTLDGEHIGQFGTQGVSNSKLNSPHGLAVDSDGFILIIDYNHRVSVFDNDGIYLHHFGSKGLETGQFKFPHGIALSHDGRRIFTSDYNNKRVQIFEIIE